MRKKNGFDAKFPLLLEQLLHKLLQDKQRIGTQHHAQMNNLEA